MFPAVDKRIDCLNLYGMSPHFFQQNLVTVHQLYMWRLSTFPTILANPFYFSVFFLFADLQGEVIYCNGFFPSSPLIIYFRVVLSINFLFLFIYL